MLERLSENARTWVYVSSNRLSQEQQSSLLKRLDSFIDSWTSHGRPVTAACEIVHNYALIVAASISEDEINAGVSGCGIDKLQNVVDRAEEDLGIKWVEPLTILFRDKTGQFSGASRSEFRSMFATGDVDAETAIFDTTLSTLREVRAHGVLRPVAETWLAHVPARHRATA
ncbi:MAG: hypothetical protein R3284_00045 [Rubricoccaceae bacterium]|nr:hypothetical protein [Rubricoccaceae bacterium]